MCWVLVECSCVSCQRVWELLYFIAMVMIQKEWYSVADWLWIGVRYYTLFLFVWAFACVYVKLKLFQCLEWVRLRSQIYETVHGGNVICCMRGQCHRHDIFVTCRDFKEMWLWILYVIGGMGTMNKYELSSRVSGRI